MPALLAVYRDRETADTVARALQERRGVAERALRVADWSDVRASIEAEMDAEISESVPSGIWGVMTIEMVRGALLFGVLGTILGVVLGAPLGYFLYDPDSSTLTRLAVGALVGGLFGSVVGTLLGGGFGMKSPAEGLAAERGVPVLVEDAPEGAESLMAEFGAIRIDRFEDGQRVATPVTEEPSGIGETLAETVANAREPERRG
jgi:hypothetical protein